MMTESEDLLDSISARSCSLVWLDNEQRAANNQGLQCCQWFAAWEFPHPDARISV